MRHSPTRTDRRPRRVAGRSARSGPGEQRDLAEYWLLVVEWISAVVPPITVLSALAVWFGYEKVIAQARYFGLNASVLDYSTTDYIRRSLDGLLAPLMQLLVAGILMLWAHLVVRAALRRPGHPAALRAAAGIGVALGAACLVVGLWVVRTPGALSGHPVLRPWILATGALLVVYAPWVHRESSGGRPGDGPPVGVLRAGYVLTGLTVFLSAFWSFSAYAVDAGTADAAALYRQHLTAFPQAIVYSRDALALTGDGVRAEPVTEAGSVYRWRYSGLRLLVRRADTYFLLPADWTPDAGTALVLHDGDGLRFEFQR